MALRDERQREPDCPSYHTRSFHKTSIARIFCGRHGSNALELRSLARTAVLHRRHISCALRGLEDINLALDVFKIVLHEQ